MMVVDVSLAPTFTAGKPRMLFEARFPSSSPHRNYDVTTDGRRFVMVQDIDPPRAPVLTHMVLIQNWFEELNRLVPTK